MDIDSFELEAFVALLRHIGSDIQEVEIKEAVGGLPKSIAETVSAFANGSGGIIVLGLSEREGFQPAKGFDAPVIAEGLAQVCSDKMEPPVRAAIEVRDLEGSLVVVARVPETAPYQKPCYIKARTPYGGSFLRMGEGDRKLSRYEVDRLLEEGHQPQHDRAVVAEATPEDLDSDQVQRFLARERANSPQVFARLSDEDALISMGVLAFDKNGVLRPTLAGLMALATHPQKYFPRVNVTFAVFPGETKEGWAHSGARLLDSRTIIGSIPVMVAETIISLRRNIRTASYVNGAGRIDVPDYPIVAVREAVANALMHRDLSPEGRASQVQVNLFSDHLEIINPGGLYGAVTVDNIGTYGVSSSRNALLSRILESVPYPETCTEKGYVVENKGTGFAQMQALLRDAGMRAAQPIDELSLFIVKMWRRETDSELYLKQRALLDSPVHGPQAGSHDPHSLPQALLDASAQGFQASDVVSFLGVSRATALRRIKQWLAEGLIVKDAQTGGRSTRYRVAH